MSIETVKCVLDKNRLITIETGKMASLANAAITIQQGETIVHVTVCSGDPRPGIDFFPLQVEYREKFSAAGRMPGGYFKREGRPSEKEILTARMTDRPIRPLFPAGYQNEIQIVSMLLSTDSENEADVLSILGASAVLMLSNIPFLGPIGAIRVGRTHGDFIVNPTHSEMQNSDLDLVYAGVADKVIMIEGSADELSEEELRDALLFANDKITAQIQAQEELTARAGKPKATPIVNLVPESIKQAVKDTCDQEIRQSCMIRDKSERQAALEQLKMKVIDTLEEKLIDSETMVDTLVENIKRAYQDLICANVRSLILENEPRSDGRTVDELRPLSCEVGLFARTHGSSLFSRGETQALVETTLGTDNDSQESDAITGGVSEKKFFLHYNFPHFSVGEVGRIMGASRREIGHGALAERSIARMFPKDFPYTVRCVSEIMASNGSTSMASICGASLSLMDAGVPLRKAVAGISCGLVSEGENHVLLTDILGSEDHYGDMDFKVAGTRDGITGFQLDLKIPGIALELLYQAMLKNKSARLKILDVMHQCIASYRAEFSQYAPRVKIIHIKPDKIGSVIGPGGKVIRGITDQFGVQIDIADDGTVKIYSDSQSKMTAAVKAIEAIVSEPEVGKIYQGKVVSIKKFGAFVEFIPGFEGLVHISEMADYRIDCVEDIISVGDTIPIKLIAIDDRGRCRLSRRRAITKKEDENTQKD